MINRRILVNFLLILVLGVFIYLLTSKDKSLPDIYKLTPLAIDAINSIKIPREDGQHILLEKQDSWIMTSPYQIRAHQFRINTLLGISQINSASRYEASQLQLADYGLDPARANISFNMTDIDFGKTNPVSGKRYLSNGEWIFLILDDTYPLVSAHATSLIDLNLIDPSKTLTYLKAPDFSLNKTAEGQWRSSVKLNPHQIQQLLKNWQQAQAYAIHRKSSRSITGQITLGFNDEKITFDIADDANWLILIRNDLQIEYHLDPALKLKLFEPDHA